MEIERAVRQNQVKDLITHILLTQNLQTLCSTALFCLNVGNVL